MRVAVIGGAGYIGSHVVLALLEAGHEPLVYDNLATGARENVHCDMVIGDILDIEALDRFLAGGFDAVIHLAARKAAGESMHRPELYATTNICGTINVLNAMVRHGIKRFIFSSTAAVYGDLEHVPVDEMHPTEPANFYGFTKLEVERILEWYEEIHELHSVALRYFNAAGYDIKGRISVPERDPSNLLPILLEAASGKREFVNVYGDDYPTPDGTCIRDYIHVTDLASAHVAALTFLGGGESNVFNLGAGRGLSVFECVDAVKRICNDFEVRVTERRPGDPPIIITSANKAHKLLGWQAMHSDVDTLIKTMAPLYGMTAKM